MGLLKYPPPKTIEHPLPLAVLLRDLFDA